MKNIITISSAFTLLFYLFGLSLPTMAQGDKDIKASNGKQKADEHKVMHLKKRAGKPPTKAIESCLNKQENSVCSFQGPRFSVHTEIEKGVCEFTPDKQYFACNPKIRPKPLQKNISEQQVIRSPSHLAVKNN